MIRLLTIGSLDLRGPHGEVRSVLTQPKRLALLVRLASEPAGSFVRRDALLAMFWPELDAPGARNALRQALFHLRKELGEGVILSRGDEELGLDPARIRADVMEFEGAVRAGDWRVALDLIHGEFAPALFVADAAPFEEWMETRRREIRRRAVDAALALTAAAERAGQVATAAGWARRAVQLEPENEVAVRRLMELLLAAGDSGGAAQAYASLEAFLRREFETAPSTATQEIRKRISPATAPAPLDSSPASILPAPATVSAVPSASASPPSRVRRSPWVPAAGALLAILAAAGVWLGRRASASDSPSALLLIAPFRTPATDTALAQTATGLMDLTAALLSGDLPYHPVDPDVGLRAIETEAGSGELGAEDGLRRAARATGAAAILTGTLVRQGARLVVAPVLLDATTGRTTSLAVLAADADSLPWLVDRMGAALLATMSATDSLDAPVLSATRLPALRAYLRGRAAMRAGRVEEAIQAFGQALEHDSTFALAARDYAEALDWAGSDRGGQAMGRAWALGGRLGARDRAILVALAGRRFPALTPVRERVEDWEAAIRLAPDRSLSWMGLGDALFHLGGVAGIRDAQPRAQVAFDEALRLDSGSAPALLHRLEMAAREGDLATVRRLAPRAEGPTVPGDATEFLRWRVALALGDSSTRRSVVAALDTMRPLALYRIVGWSQLDGVGVDDAGVALRALRGTPRTGPESDRALYMAAVYELNRGRPLAASALLDAAGYGGGPANAVMYAADAGVREEVAVLEREVTAGQDTSARSREVLGYFRLWRGEAFDAGWARGYLSGLDHDSYPGSDALGCLVAARLGDGSAVARMHRADSLLDQIAAGEHVGPAPLVLARCHEALGDRRGALVLLGRQSLDPTYGPSALAGMLYEEGRLALLARDRPRALQAWRRFLRLRADPEPALVPQRDSLQRLVDSLAR